MNRLAAVACFCLAAAPALATDAMRVALDLGTVIGSEQSCGLSFDQAAIAAFVEDNVPAADMSFMSTMNMSADVTADEIGGFTASRKTAHCAQVTRIAKANGFIR